MKVSYNTHCIYVIGDSHARFWGGWSGSVPPQKISNKFNVFHLGPCLAYSMKNYGTRSRGREKFDELLKTFQIPQKATVLACFGEIDLRCHVMRDGVDKMMERMNVSIANYMEFIDIYSEQVNFMIYGPIASQKDCWIEHPAYPRIGNELERNIATLIYNQKLAWECNQRGIFFFSLFSKLINENLMTRSEYICDQCHLSNNFYFDFIKKFETQYKKWCLQS